MRPFHRASHPWAKKLRATRGAKATSLTRSSFALRRGGIQGSGGGMRSMKRRQHAVQDAAVVPLLELLLHLVELLESQHVARVVLVRTRDKGVVGTRGDLARKERSRCGRGRPRFLHFGLRAGGAHLGLPEPRREGGVFEAVLVSEFVQSGQALQDRREQIVLSPYHALPSDGDFPARGDQRGQLFHHVAHPIRPGGQLQFRSHALVEEHGDRVGARQMRGIAAQHEHRVELPQPGRG